MVLEFNEKTDVDDDVDKDNKHPPGILAGTVFSLSCHVQCAPTWKKKKWELKKMQQKSY